MKSAPHRRRLRRGPIVVLFIIVFVVGSFLLFSNASAPTLSTNENWKKKQSEAVKQKSTTVARKDGKHTVPHTTTSSPSTRAPASRDTKCNYSFECNATEYTEIDKDVNRILNFEIKGNTDKISFDEYDLSDLSDVPAIEGGLYTDRQDLDKPRENEKYVTFAKYLDCLGARLGVDYKNQKELELSEEEAQKSFPYVVSMATVELGDIKTIMCNINVPIQHMMYVINSDVTSVTNFFHDVEKTFNFTKRLRVHWPGYNMGFAGAVNFGMRDAMRYSFDEVPFFFVLNNDVRYPPETLPASLPEFRKVTKQDKEMLESLRKEVAAEPSEYTPAHRRHPLLRSTDNSTLLVTSTALPDRIRYMTADQRKAIFSKYYGGLFFDPKGDTAALGMSRLAMETVGFMDENFYPAYYEDIDWRYRQFRLGLSDFIVKDIPYKKHYINALLKLGSRYAMRPSTATEAERFAAHATNILTTVPNFRMVFMKYGYNHRNSIGPYAECHELPVDAWVMDVPRRFAMMKALQLSRSFFNGNISTKEASKATKYILNWLPQEERTEIVRAISGRSITDVIGGAFKECKLIRHETQ